MRNGAGWPKNLAPADPSRHGSLRAWAIRVPLDADAEPARPTGGGEDVAARFLSRDYGGYWDLWISDDKAVIEREAFKVYGERCDIGGVRLEVEAVRVKPDGSGVVRYSVEDHPTGETFFLVEDGQWLIDVGPKSAEDAASGTC
jgi:hypothetical protein